jgi:hypothetical protein
MSETLLLIDIPPLTPQRAVIEAQAIHAEILSTTSISRIENPAGHFLEEEAGEVILMMAGVVAPCIV